MNLTTQLTEIEKAELETLEGIIGRSVKSFVDVGNALLTIRDQGLYREGHKTFNDYCKAKWGMSKTHANRLITGSQVVENLTPRGVTMPLCEIQPINEYQVRPLVVLDPGQQCEVWEEAVRTADGKVVTYKQVKALVAELVAPAAVTPPEAPKAPKVHPEYTDAVGFALVALSQLGRIRDEDYKRDVAIKMISDWVEEAKNKIIKKRRGK